MSEFADTPEQRPPKQRIESAAEYLQERLQYLGSFESLVLAIQHDYTGDKIVRKHGDTKTIHIMGDTQTDTPLGAGESYEDANGTGHLYQLLRIAQNLVHEDTPSDHSTHAFYAGELIATTVIDYLTSHENNVPSSILATLSGKQEATWLAELKKTLDTMQREGDVKGLLGTSSFPTAAQNYAVHQDVANHMRLKAYEFSFDEKGSNADMRKLLESLTQNVPAEKLVHIETGYWVMMHAWLKPEHHDEERTFDLVKETMPAGNQPNRDALFDTAKRSLELDEESHTAPEKPPLETVATTEYDEEIQALELAFHDNEIDFDVEEWNRESLEELALSVVEQSYSIRAANSLTHDEKDPAVAKKLNRTLKKKLERFVKKNFGIDQDDLLYAHGTFVGLANSMLPAAEYNAQGILDSENKQYVYQNMSTHDYRNLIRNPKADIIEYEVRGTFDQITITTTMIDEQSYTVDVDDVASHEQLTFESFIPAIRLLNVSIIDMNQNVAVDHIEDIIIPLTHSHLELGRFVPPAPESD